MGLFVSKGCGDSDELYLRGGEVCTDSCRDRGFYCNAPVLSYGKPCPKPDMFTQDEWAGLISKARELYDARTP